MAAKKFEWTDEIEELVLDEHSSGRTLLDICKGETTPVDSAGLKLTYQMICSHERESAVFRANLKLSIEQYCRVLFDECISIADDTTSDWRRRVTNGGKEVDEVDGAVIARSKVMIDTRMKILAKINPEKYGDPKKSIEVTGKGGGPIETKDVSDLDMARRMAFILERGKRAKLAGTNAGTASVSIHPAAAAMIAQVVATGDDEL